jgi:hypothetical protein
MHFQVTCKKISNLNANYNELLKFTPKNSNQITNPTNPFNVLKKKHVYADH